MNSASESVTWHREHWHFYRQI